MKFIKIILICTLLNACAVGTYLTTNPYLQRSTKLDTSYVRSQLQLVAELSGRMLTGTERLPDVYLVNDSVDFYAVTCKQHHIQCGLGSTLATHLPYDHIIYVNVQRIEDIHTQDAIVLHELVHHLQTLQHDKRSCIEREQEAYSVEYKFLNINPPISIYRSAVSSCDDADNTFS